MLKIKARDIIKGWPCGRSTVSYHSEWEYFDIWPMISWYSTDMKDQLQLERLYHQMQQAMVNEYLHDPKAFYDKYIDSLIPRALPGELGKAVSINEEIFELEPEDKPLWVWP